MDVRVSSDSLGEVHIPADAYYGPQTRRAVENFPISGMRLPRFFIEAQGLIKASAAAAHVKLNELETKIGDAIIRAAEEVIEGKWDHQFVVDVFQAGAGTSQNMNANEVIANRALELLGYERDRKDIIHPNDHVNKGQSTNDTIPAAMYIATYHAVHRQLLPVLNELYWALINRAAAFRHVLKSGRTHLQDAVPMRLGQEFAGYAAHIEAVTKQIVRISDDLLDIGIGGNAVGTGINTHPKYSTYVVEELRNRTGIKWRLPDEGKRFAFMQNPVVVVRVSGLLKELAIHLIKISSDLRLLSSGPRTGLAEIRLPAVQPGSSIMPGKVNPVLPEMMYMVCSQVIGNDTALSTAATGSQLEINVMMPVMAHLILQSISILSHGVKTFTIKCVEGIEANEENCHYWMEQSLGLVTMLNPIIGYDRAALLTYRAVEHGLSIKDVVIEEGVISEVEWNELIQKSAPLPEMVNLDV